MRFVVVGAGGVGGYLGVRLAEAGHDVAWLVRGRTLAALRATGITLENSLGDVRLGPQRASDQPADLGLADAVLVTTKLYDLPALAPRLAPLIGPQTTVLPLQNGVDSHPVLAAALGPGPVLKGTVTIKSFAAAPGHIICKSPFCKIRFADGDGAHSPRVEGLRAALATGKGVDVALAPDIDAEIWRKFFMLASFSAVACMARAPIGAVLDCAPARALVVEAALEAAAVGRAEGVNIPADVAEQVIAQVNLMPRDGRPSMLEDLEAGRPLELPFFSGAVVRLGRQHGIPTPIHAVAAQALAIHEQGRPA